MTRRPIDETLDDAGGGPVGPGQTENLSDPGTGNSGPTEATVSLGLGGAAPVPAPLAQAAVAAAAARFGAPQSPDRSPDRAPERTIDTGNGPPAAWDPATVITRAQDLPVVDPNNYEMLEEYARGGLGRIVRARDLRTGRLVAIKEMLGRSDDAARRFAREALITANLQHPSIVPVYELGRWTAGGPFYAMKLVAGRPLKKVIKDCKSFDERLALLPTIVSIADAIAYAHSRRVIHRDLKPDNVLVGDHGETVVIDWGLAKSLDDNSETPSLDAIVVPEGVAPMHTMVGVVMGTPQYMPPEQARGEATDERSDVYQIGAMLYQLIAGAAPWTGSIYQNTRELVSAVATSSPKPLVEREPATPPDLLTIVAKAMARNPADRYPDAGALSDDLRRFTTGQLVRAHAYDRRTLFKRWLKRNRAPVTVAAILVWILATFAVWSVNRIVAERDVSRVERDRARAETARAETSLGAALYEKGYVAENAQEWARAAMYYAASRTHHDSVASAWAAGLAEARSVVPIVRHTQPAWVHAVAISPDGGRVATVDDSGELHVWDPRDGRVLVQKKLGHGALYAVAFHPTGNELAVAGDDGVIERMTPDLAPLSQLSGHKGRVWTLAYSPDGSLLASGAEDAKVRLWPIAAGATPREMSGHVQRVYSVAFSPDGKTLASGGDDRRLWVWDVASGTGAQRGEHAAGGIRIVSFAAAGEPLVSAGWDHEIRVWRGKTGAPEVWTEADVVHGGTFTPIGNLLVVGGELGGIHIWDVSTRQLVTVLGNIPEQTSAIAISRDGHWLVTAGKSAPTAWDASALHRLAPLGHRGNVPGLAFNREGTKFVSGGADHTLRVWDLATAKEIRRISTGNVLCSDGVVLLPGDDVASTCEDGTVRRWAADGTERSIPTNGWMRVTSLSPDGTVLAAGHLFGRLVLVDIATWSVISDHTLHEHQIYGVQYAADGRIVTASLDDHVRVWRPGDFTKDIDVRVGTDDGVLAAALTPDGKELVIGTQEGSIDVWSTATSAWKLRDGAGGTLGTVWRVAMSPDGSRAYTASNDGIIRAWDTKTWQVKTQMDAGEDAAIGLSISPDGHSLLGGYESGAIVVWNPETGTLVRRIGGKTRERGSCADIATQAWANDEHRAIVSAACTAGPRDYFDQLAKRSQQRIDNEVDAVWAWAPR